MNKLRISLKLLVARPALVLYVLAAAFIGIWRAPLDSVRRRVLKTYPWAAMAFPSLLIGGVVGFLGNDTGIVMLGLMALSAVVAGVVLALEPPGPIVLRMIP